MGPACPHRVAYLEGGPALRQGLQHARSVREGPEGGQAPRTLLRSCPGRRQLDLRLRLQGLPIGLGQLQVCSLGRALEQEGGLQQHGPHAAQPVLRNRPAPISTLHFDDMQPRPQGAP